MEKKKDETRRYSVRVEYLIEHDEASCDQAVRDATYYIPQGARDLRLAVVNAKRIEPKPEPKPEPVQVPTAAEPIYQPEHSTLGAMQGQSSATDEIPF